MVQEKEPSLCGISTFVELGCRMVQVEDLEHWGVGIVVESRCWLVQEKEPLCSVDCSVLQGSESL